MHAISDPHLLDESGRRRGKKDEEGSGLMGFRVATIRRVGGRSRQVIEVRLIRRYWGLSYFMIYFYPVYRTGGSNVRGATRASQKNIDEQ